MGIVVTLKVCLLLLFCLLLFITFRASREHVLEISSFALKKKLTSATQATEHLQFQFSGDRALGANPSPPLERIMIRPVTNTPRYTTERMHHARPVVNAHHTSTNY